MPNGLAWRGFFRRSHGVGATECPSRSTDFDKGPWRWTTRTDEAVYLGDLVVLSLPRYPAAVGRIVGKKPCGLINCVLVHGLNVLPGDAVDVAEPQLLAKVQDGQLFYLPAF